MRIHVPDAEARLRVDTGEVELACLTWGQEGPWVLLIHGFPDTPHTWSEVGPALAELGYRVVAPYTRGIPPSTAPADGAYDSDSMARDMIKVLDAIGAERARVIGHDFGAGIAYTLAGLAPERVEQLVTVAIPHPATIKPRLSLLWGARHFVTHRFPWAVRSFSSGDFAQIRVLYERWSPTHDWPEEEFEAAKNAYAAPGGCAAALAYYRWVNAPSEGLRQRIACPSVVVGGRDDGVATEADFEASRRRFDGPVDVVMVPGGHFLHREHLQPFLEVVRGFFGPATPPPKPVERRL